MSLLLRRLGAGRTVAIGQAVETDTALAVTHRRAKIIGLPVETDTALAVSHSRALRIGQAVETDTALPVTKGGRTISVGLAVETDSALAVTFVKRVPAPALLPSSLTRRVPRVPPRRARRRVTIGLAVEHDQALPVRALLTPKPPPTDRLMMDLPPLEVRDRELAELVALELI